MRSALQLALFACFGLAAQTPVRPALDFDPQHKIFADAALSFQDYRIELRTSKSKPTGELKDIRFLHKWKLVANFPNEAEFGHNHFGIFPLLSEDGKQLVIEQYTGGAHCCTHYWIYDLRIEPVLIYRSEDYYVGYEAVFADLDEDGSYEIDQRLLTFDYFDRCSHADSPFPNALFKYDSRRREYLPANSHFASRLLKPLDASRRDLEDYRRQSAPGGYDESGVYLGRVLKVLTTYLYAGEIEKGWNFFDREYALPDKIEMRRKIETQLRKDALYLAIEKETKTRKGRQ